MPDRTASVCSAIKADREAFAARWAGWATGLGIDPKGPLSALGDGAAWVWTATTEHSSAATQVLDILRASQHLATAAAGLFGAGTLAAGEWLAATRDRLLADGWNGLLDQISNQTPVEDRSAAGQAALDETNGYAAEHTTRMQPCGRLQAGQSIGRGSIEGLAKRMGHRLKVAGRCWGVEHLDGMAALIATADTPEWSGLWVRPAA